jgi:5-methylcytosine-specific restriction endonuclease McrA
MQRAEILAAVCDLLAQGRIDDAKTLLLAEYPRASASTSRRPWSLKRLVRVFVRDGFTDRYFGDRLVFPGALRALAILLTEAFPYHRNWKQSATHPAFYELYPTIDHVVPVARGGADDEANVVTTSMLRNSAKANWLLEELHWPVDRAPIVPDWDGLLGWFMSACTAHEALRRDVAVQRWRQAALEANAA